MTSQALNAGSLGLECFVKDYMLKEGRVQGTPF